LPYSLLPFVFDNVKDILLEKFSEILGGNAYVHVVVYLHGNANAVTLSDTKAARKDYLVLNMMLGNRILKELNDLGRALKMAG
jgi:hypothetical protein